MNVDINQDQQNEPGLQHVYIMLLKASGLKGRLSLFLYWTTKMAAEMFYSPSDKNVCVREREKRERERERDFEHFRFVFNFSNVKRINEPDIG